MDGTNTFHVYSISNKHMSRYKNFCDKLQSFHLKMLATDTEFKENNKVHFQCQEGHESVITAASFINKTAPKNIGKVKSLCTECNTMLLKAEVQLHKSL